MVRIEFRKRGGKDGMHHQAGVARQPRTVPEAAASRRRTIDRMLWLCPVLSLVVAAALFWLAGLTIWTAVLAATLVACPLAVAFALLAEWLGKRSPNN
jgi:hypothetical protein